LIDRLLKEERGYSLVEVIVSILLLSIAIIPMVGMFDMGINSATKASDYDKARALANLKLEQAKNLPFVDVQDNFPEGIGTPYDDESDPLFTEPGDEFAKFQYDIVKLYMQDPPTEPDFETSADSGAEVTGLIRVNVTVYWDDDNVPDDDLSDDKKFTTWGLVAE
jgi:prepilin-type N-terminal cleavage/methylation domain-containing protein